MKPFLVICLNPVFQKTFCLDSLRPGEVNRSAEYYDDISGKGVNVARVLAQLGHEAIYLTHTGGENRAAFLEAAHAEGIEITDIDSHSPIRGCYTLIDRQAGRTTEIVEEARPVAEGTEQAVFAAYEGLLERVGLVIISGSRAAGYSPRTYPHMVERAKAAGLPVILDLRGEDLILCLHYQPDIIKPNLAEFAATFLDRADITEQDESDDLVSLASLKMLEMKALQGVSTILTRGPRETLYLDGSQVSRMAPAPIDPVNTIGCGDAFTAGFASVWGAGITGEGKLGSLATLMRAQPIDAPNGDTGSHQSGDTGAFGDNAADTAAPGQPETDETEKESLMTLAVRNGMECARLNALNIRPGSIR